MLALLTERPAISTVRVYSRDRSNRQGFAETYAKAFGVAIEPVNSPELAVEPVDVVVCATSTNKVLFDGNWLREGQHVTGIIGGNIQLVQGGFLKESRRELDDRTAERADLIVANLRRVGR